MLAFLCNAVYDKQTCVCVLPFPCSLVFCSICFFLVLPKLTKYSFPRWLAAWTFRMTSTGSSPGKLLLSWLNEEASTNISALIHWILKVCTSHAFKEPFKLKRWPFVRIPKAMALSWLPRRSVTIASQQNRWIVLPWAEVHDKLSRPSKSL